MYHIFFIHSSVNGHLGCFHVLAIVNSANTAMTTGFTYVFFKFGFLRVYAQEWDCWVTWCFYSQLFKESPCHLPQWLYQFTFPLTVMCHIFIYSFVIYIYCCCHSVAQSCLTLCDPMDCSMSGLPVPHHLLEFPGVHAHCISDAIEPSYPCLTLLLLLSFPPSGSFPVSQLFTSGDQSIGASASILPMSIQG